MHEWQSDRLLCTLPVSLRNLLIKISLIMIPRRCPYKSQLLLFVGVFSRQGPSQLPVSSLAMFLCPLGESDKDLPSARYSLSCQTGEKRSGCKLCLPAGFPCIPYPLHTTKCLPPQISIPLSQLWTPSFTSVPPVLPPSAPLLSLTVITEVCFRTEIKACSDLQEGRTVSQHHWQSLQTQTHTGMSRPVGWLTRWGSVCRLANWPANST